MIMTSHSPLLHSTAPNVCDDECTLCDDCSVECSHSLHTLSLRLFCWTRCLHSHFWLNALCLCSVGKMWCPNPFWFAYPYKKCYYLKRLRRETHVVTQFFFSCLLPNAMYVNFCLMLIVEYFWLDVGAIIAGIASQEINRLTGGLWCLSPSMSPSPLKAPSDIAGSGWIAIESRCFVLNAET